MEQFTKEQLEQMIGDHYLDGDSRCPECSRGLYPEKKRESENYPVCFRFTCKDCNKIGQLLDETHWEKRKWSIDEQRKIKDNYQENQDILCPFDNSRLEKSPTTQFFGKSKRFKIVISCLRCNNSLTVEVK